MDYPDILKTDSEVIVIGPDNESSFRNYWDKEDLPFIGLPDPDHIVLTRYGQEFKLLKLGRMPAQMLIDKSGMLRYVHYGQSMSDIPSSSEIVALLGS
ncbi:MAG: redoxin family protein [Candidatus Latescibacterota bacterium]|nr:MAG: redoxin family protein [Candidatus Latescibacterota bacterium]